MLTGEDECAVSAALLICEQALNERQEAAAYVPMKFLGA
jgi:hypothetical protein